MLEIIKSNYIRYCGGNHGMAADQQYRTPDPGRKADPVSGDQ